ncbi:zinc-binding alcohol dehydrogenase family protein [Patulibacter sp. NPDC049589]|uniref:zinc-binding alcohol dehydrogenase family protein n=1 Tax=Patulibacter sp. NPDC049589 TaxID=3154731 RepID=UPI00343E3224
MPRTIKSPNRVAMHAAVVRSFSEPPRHERVPEPEPAGDHEVVIDVLAAALHPRVRSQADGSHYESTGALPIVPGIDGVGRTADGELRYFVLPDTDRGSMAGRAVIDRRRSAVLPDDIDVVAVAAAVNPAMSSWIALRRRIAFRPGMNVLVLGATGNAGRMAIQVARHLGAGTVVAAGRDPDRMALLPGLGADHVVPLTGDPEAVDRALAGAADDADVDVVIDYLWGTATERALPAVLGRRSDRSRPLDWIQVGSMAGLEIPLRSEWLRAARLQLVGSGQGAVPTRDIVEELPLLAAHVATDHYAIDAVPVPLRDVHAAWTADRPAGARTVLVPGEADRAG